MRMMRKREHSQYATPQFGLEIKNQQLFINCLSECVKIYRKKEEFYLKILLRIFINDRSQIFNPQVHEARMLAVKIHEFQSQHEQLVSEEEEVLGSVQKYEGQKFYFSKTYLYTVYVRLSQLLESTKEKIFAKANKFDNINALEKVSDDSKTSILQHYQNLLSQQKYDASSLLIFARKNQNKKIFSILPPKIRKPQISLNPLKRFQSSKMDKNNSIDVPCSKKEKIQSILAYKLGTNSRFNKKEKNIMNPEKIYQKTEDCISRPNAKKGKEKNIFKVLYGIMGIKVKKVELSSVFRLNLQDEGLQRNQLIKKERQKYRQNFQLRNIYLKLSAKKKKTEE